MAIDDGSDYLKELFDVAWEKETIQLCKIQTFRSKGVVTEKEVRDSIRECRSIICGLAEQFNQENLTNNSLNFFQWAGSLDGGDNIVGIHNPSESQIDENSYWTFGFRIGPAEPETKLTLVCHLDTVPATPGPAWEVNPFDPELKLKDYPGGAEETQNFLVGRGTLDDKGPAVSAFVAVRALAKAFDKTDRFEKTQLEIIFDTSEETDMSTPRFWGDNPKEAPDFGIVYDAMWCVRAEKGGERPVFWVKPSNVSSDSNGLVLSTLITNPDNSCNTIPDWVKADVTGNRAEITKFAAVVEQWFRDLEYPADPNYNPGNLKVTTSDTGDKVTLEIHVEGAQHASAPDENKENGVNPLVSMANFLASLAERDVFATNEVVSMVTFIQWTWGTFVFGEKHESMYKYDEVFTENNGTTYAVSKMSAPTEPEEKVGAIMLEIDIRYAIGHHSEAWDGVKEGCLDGDNSTFGTVFTDLVTEFNATHSDLPDVIYDGVNTIFTPDIRAPDTNPNFQRAIEAFKTVMYVEPPQLAIGGGTDAKDNTSVLALGPLFCPRLGPPVNYHGINEGAPVCDLRKSTQIIYELCRLEISDPTAAQIPVEMRMKKKNKIAEMYKKLATRGSKIACNH